MSQSMRCDISCDTSLLCIILNQFILLVLAYHPVAIWYNIIWEVLAIAYYVIYVRKRPIPQEAIDAEAIALATVEPTAEERVKLDAQYKRWRITAYCFAVAGVLLFAISWIMK